MKLVLASGNVKKAKELTALLAPLGVDVRLQSSFNVIQPPEDGSTFVENAIIKARAAALQTGLPAIADDSGLVVDALAGAPGVYSARYAGEEASDTDNNDKLLAAMLGVPEMKRTARFVSVVVYMRHALDPLPLIAQGVWEGRILDKAVGEGGFGYDPLFYVPSHGCASAQLDAVEKNRISHRGQSMQALLAQLTALSSQ